MTEERESDLTRIDRWIGGVKRDPWPPAVPAPGIGFRRMPTGPSSFARQKLHQDSRLVPVVLNEHDFYANCPNSRWRQAEPGECGACKGARFMAVVRRNARAELVATGKVRVCSVCGGR